MESSEVAKDGAGVNSSIADGAAKAPPPVVLQVLPALETGGVERGTVDITEAIAGAGWTALVASSGGPMVREVERAGGTHLTLPADTKNPLSMRANAGRIATLVAAHGVDIVHARSRAPAWSARAAARRTGVPFVTTFHGTYGASNWLKRRYNSVMARGDRVIAISNFIAGLVTSEYGVEPGRVRVIPRGIDFEIFDPAAVSAERMIQLSKQWRLPDGVPVIMLPGRLTRWKGHGVLVEALARLGRDDVRCVLVGADQGRSRYRQEIEDHIARAGVGPLVQQVGNCRDMAAAYMLADVVVSASTDPEGFGRVAAEAQAVGKPVVATDHGAARETVVDGETGWLVPPGDPDALAAALARVLAMNSAEREALGERSMAHVRGHFSRDEMCRASLAVYRELLPRSAAAS